MIIVKHTSIAVLIAGATVCLSVFGAGCAQKPAISPTERTVRPLPAPQGPPPTPPPGIPAPTPVKAQ